MVVMMMMMMTMMLMLLQARSLWRFANPSAPPGRVWNDAVHRNASQFQSGDVTADNVPRRQPEVDVLRRKVAGAESGVRVPRVRQTVQRSLQPNEAYARAHRSTPVRLQGDDAQRIVYVVYREPVTGPRCPRIVHRQSLWLTCGTPLGCRRRGRSCSPVGVKIKMASISNQLVICQSVFLFLEIEA